ncbi:MAG: tetratricopeptide repeat protein [Anaerolineales bacterium]|nr:tetratricopeptide repeat protein [Anaerolineales bacterium]
MGHPEYIIEVTEATFEEAVLVCSQSVPVVVDFWAPWCVPCRTLGPLLERLAQAGGGAFRLAKVNADENPNLAAQYSVRGLPTVKAFREGRVVAEFTGLIPEPKVREFLRKLAPTPADQALSEGLSFLATRHWAQAEAACRTALELEPANGAAGLGLLQALLRQGRGCEAADLLDNFPRGDEIVAAEKLRPLAEFLCEVEGADPPLEDSDQTALYHQAARLFARGQWEAALDGVLEVLRQDRRYRRGEARQVLLAVFELFGEADPLTRQYRTELASVLF